MDKTEDLELMELQELALKRGRQHKSLAETRMIVKAYLLNHVPIKQLSADFGVSCRSTSMMWLSSTPSESRWLWNKVFNR